MPWRRQKLCLRCDPGPMRHLNTILDIIGALSILCGALAAVLPDGRIKTACSYLGLRGGKAVQALRATSEPEPTGKP